MQPRATSHDALSRPPSPVAAPIGAPSFAATAARTAHAPSAEAGAGGDELGSDGGADLVAGGALLETGLAQRDPSLATDPSPELAPFRPGPGMPTDGTGVEAVEAIGEDGLTADGPGPGAPSGDVEGGGDISDSVDEGAGMDGNNEPAEAPPADAGAQGGER
jgi:hypothetical protein